MHISERIKNLRLELGLSQEEFANSIGLTRGNYAGIELGKQLPTIATLQKIVGIYHKNYDWLIDGTNANLNANLNAYLKGKKQYRDDNASSEVNEPIIEYNSKGIPLYNVAASAGLIEMYDDEQEKVVGTITIPGFMDCDVALTNFGHSMYPTYESGSILLCRQIKDKSLILYGESYLLRTQEYRTVKRLLAGQSGIILAVSDNDETRKNGSRKYPDIPIKITQILQLWLIKGIIKKNQI